MKKVSYILFVVLVSLSCYSQENYSLDGGKVTQYEMSMTEYPKDPEAEALVIYEVGNYNFIFNERSGFLLKMTIHTKIKILSQAGEKYASFEIPLFSRDSRTEEVLEDVEGKTFNYEDGKLIITDFIPKGNIFEEKINENWTRHKLTLPNVKPGSVVELKYTITTPFFVNMRAWTFQKKIPVNYSRLRYLAIPYYEYVFSAIGITELDEQTSKVLTGEHRHGRLVYQEMEHIYGLKNIPAFRDEEFISSSKDYMMSLNFQLAKIYHPTGGETNYVSTWKELSEKLLKDSQFGKYIDNSRKEARKILPTLPIEGLSEIDKVKVISEYVKSNFSWDGFYGEYSNQKVSDFLKNKKGNSGDINLFLTGMLSEAGIKTSPVILSTREHGRINKSYPFMQYFNYVVPEVYLNQSIIHIDATEPMLPFSTVPLRCLNLEGLVVEKDPRWTFIKQRGSDYLQRNLDISFENINSVNVDATFSSVGNRAYIYRSQYLKNSEELIKHLKDTEDINVNGEIKVENYTDLQKPFKFDFSFKTAAEGNDKKIFINSFSGLIPRNNIFKQSKRTHPIDLSNLITRQYIVNINIPEGYEIESLPEELMLDNDVMQISYSATVNDNSINIKGLYSFKNYIFSAEQYPLLKDSYAKMLSKYSEMIVLKKKGEI